MLKCYICSTVTGARIVWWQVTGVRATVNRAAFRASLRQQTFISTSSATVSRHTLHSGTMPDRSEYQPLVQDVDDEVDVVDPLPTPVTAASVSGLRRMQRPGHIDLSKLDNAFKRCVSCSVLWQYRSADTGMRWTESIAQKVKRKKKVEDKSRKEIWHSVFAPQVEPVFIDDSPVSSHNLLLCAVSYIASAQPKTLDHKPPMTKANFDQ